MLKSMLEKELLDYVAMDIKADLATYSKAAGVTVDTAAIERSIDLLRNSGIEYEFRTTVVPQFYNETIAENIGQLIEGGSKYYLQEFVPKNTLDPTFEEVEPYLPSTFEKFAKILRPYIQTEVR